MESKKMKKILFLISVILLLVFVFFLLYQPFFEKNITVKFFNNKKFETKCKIFKSNDFCIIYNDKKNDFYIINLKNKSIILPYQISDYFLFDSILLWRRDRLEGVNLDYAPKTGEQKIIWSKSKLEFTHGINQAEKYIINF
ncbi:MAG: hypothetical protein GY714_31960 [Desulfobacterales bacterium]|nr:hypothetical protein [Desulfobacterales bacterium]